LRADYERYRIVAKPTPPLFREPARFETKVRKSKLARMLLFEGRRARDESMTTGHALR
jgi:hypothetical protein